LPRVRPSLSAMSATTPPARTMTARTPRLT